MDYLVIMNKKRNKSNTIVFNGKTTYLFFLGKLAKLQFEKKTFDKKVTRQALKKVIQLF